MVPASRDTNRTAQEEKVSAADPTLALPQVETTVARLQASREKATGCGVFPRIPAGSPAVDRYEPIVLSDEAVLYSYTVIHPSPKTGLPPFVLAYADFPEDTRIFGRLEIAPGARPAIGMRIRPVRKTDDAEGYAFAPVEGGMA
jgi:uncharacterized protein